MNKVPFFIIQKIPFYSLSIHFFKNTWNIFFFFCNFYYNKIKLINLSKYYAVTLYFIINNKPFALKKCALFGKCQKCYYNKCKCIEFYTWCRNIITVSMVLFMKILLTNNKISERLGKDTWIAFRNKTTNSSKTKKNIKKAPNVD